MSDYEPPQNDAVDFTLESYDPPGNDAIDFSLEESGDTEPEPDPEPDQPSEPSPFQLPNDPADFPLELDLPTSALNLRTMNTGIAVFFVGTLTFLGAAVVVLRNYVAGTLLGVAVLALLMSGTIGLPLELFWGCLILVVVALIVGVVWRGLE